MGAFKTSCEAGRRGRSMMPQTTTEEVRANIYNGLGRMAQTFRICESVLTNWVQPRPVSDRGSGSLLGAMSIYFGNKLPIDCAHARPQADCMTLPRVASSLRVASSAHSGRLLARAQGKPTEQDLQALGAACKQVSTTWIVNWDGSVFRGVQRRQHRPWSKTILTESPFRGTRPTTSRL